MFPWTWSKAFAIALMCLGLILMIAARWHEPDESRLRRTGISLIGAVVSKNPVIIQKRNGIASFPGSITVEYSAESGKRRSEFDVAPTVYEAINLGDKVSLLVDPANPGRSTLANQSWLSATSDKESSAGSVVLVLGILWFIGSVVYDRLKPSAPTREDPPEWANL